MTDPAPVVDWETTAKELAQLVLQLRSAPVGTGANQAHQPPAPPASRGPVSASNSPPTVPGGLTAFATALANQPSKPEPVDPEFVGREPFVFKVDGRPEGTVGRGTFNLQRALDIDKFTYKLIKNMTRRVCIQCNFDMRLAFSFHPIRKRNQASAKLLDLVPEFNQFEDPQWPIDAFLLVVLKGSSQSVQNANRVRLKKLAEQAGHVAKEHKSRLTKERKTPAAKGRKSRNTAPLPIAHNAVDALTHDMSMASINPNDDVDTDKSQNVDDHEMEMDTGPVLQDSDSVLAPFAALALDETHASAAPALGAPTPNTVDAQDPGIPRTKSRLRPTPRLPASVNGAAASVPTPAEVQALPAVRSTRSTRSTINTTATATSDAPVLGPASATPPPPNNPVTAVRKLVRGLTDNHQERLPAALCTHAPDPTPKAPLKRGKKKAEPAPEPEPTEDDSTGEPEPMAETTGAKGRGKQNGKANKTQPRVEEKPTQTKSAKAASGATKANAKDKTTTGKRKASKK